MSDTATALPQPTLHRRGRKGYTFVAIGALVSAAVVLLSVVLTAVYGGSAALSMCALAAWVAFTGMYLSDALGDLLTRHRTTRASRTLYDAYLLVYAQQHTASYLNAAARTTLTDAYLAAAAVEAEAVKADKRGKKGLRVSRKGRRAQHVVEQLQHQLAAAQQTRATTIAQA